MPALQLSELHFRWPGSAHDQLYIPDMQLAQAQRALLLGPSGSGKSTLLGLIAGLYTPNQGHVKVLGQDLASLSPARRDHFRADHMGFVFQQFNLLPYLSALDNVLLPLRFSRRRRQRAGNAPAEARRLLEELQLAEPCWAQPPHQLSVGQQQRVAVARALIGGPELLIADEPTSALDADTRDQFLALLMQELNRHGSTLLMVSHDASLASRFDGVLNLNQLNLAGAAPC